MPWPFSLYVGASEMGVGIKKRKWARRQWLMPVILATQKAEIRGITIQSQPRQIV
jgi:hypothetical protein